MLSKRLAPVMLRRDRRIVSDQLPDKIVQRLDVEMSPKQIELHGGVPTAKRGELMESFLKDDHV